MQKNHLSKENAKTRNYAPPISHVSPITIESLICASGDDIQGTEMVDEIDGIW